MKTIVLLASLLCAQASFAFSNCSQYEAQVSAHVEASENLQNGQYWLKLNFVDQDSFSAHMLCPLAQDEITTQGVLTNRPYLPGETVSGVLVRYDQSALIYLN